MSQASSAAIANRMWCERVAARLACLLAALSHTVVYRLGVGVEGGLSAAASSDVPCGEGGRRAGQEPPQAQKKGATALRRGAMQWWRCCASTTRRWATRWGVPPDLDRCDGDLQQLL